MLRPLSATRLAARRTFPRHPALRALATTPTRAASSKKPPMPLDMPREDYAEPAVYTLSIISRTFKYLIYGTLGLGVTAYAVFEGVHAYIEHVPLAPPSHAAEGDAYAWADENQAWTGGARGGTDPALGWRGRHALRGAWLCWEWGAGDANSTIARHPHGKQGMISYSKKGALSVDRGYELAEEYIDAAIRVAEKKGMVFPPGLPYSPDEMRAHTDASPEPGTPDATALDLLTLKAGLLERMGEDTLDHARELYARVAGAYKHTEGAVMGARAMRLAHKLGDLAQRAGETDVAWRWWNWGLERAGMRLPPLKSEEERGSSWWPFGSSTPSEATTMDVPATALATPLRRAAVSILVSASAASAQAGALPTSAAVQAAGLSLLPATTPSTPQAGESAAGLQELWDAQRHALFTLHSASVTHAQDKNAQGKNAKGKNASALDLAAQSADESEAVLAVLNPTLPAALSKPKSNPCTQPAKRLVRDTLTTGAEAYYTLGVLVERSADKGKDKDTDTLHRLEHAAESFERAMSLSAAEEGEDDGRGRGRGRGDWARQRVDAILEGICARAGPGRATY
ncbi:hypothetical protein CspeluHIS016_0106030 [Cutaneotrichosporon spelunceum]|uniref:Uncharacterized protein n=1 Tax=Cutaneotrichosporon spelunceum TaxID=1672016 RepID=A0AAD3TNV4_9TREE|nr:hypothetical protein CspeluHIS016_0106030 [Cutaneotrichosporon spelunceum]